MGCSYWLLIRPVHKAWQNSDVRFFNFRKSGRSCNPGENFCQAHPYSQKTLLFEYIKGGTTPNLVGMVPQAGDNPAEISREEQQKIILEQITAFLDSLKQ